MQTLKRCGVVFGNGLVQLGKALMLPIAVLPIAGLLLRLGQPDLLNIAFISQAGGAVFNNLPLIFAIGVAIGFAHENHGAAALASFIGYVIMTAAALNFPLIWHFLADDVLYQLLPAQLVYLLPG